MLLITRTSVSKTGWGIHTARDVAGTRVRGKKDGGPIGSVRMCKVWTGQEQQVLVVVHRWRMD